MRTKTSCFIFIVLLAICVVSSPILAGDYKRTSTPDWNSSFMRCEAKAYVGAHTTDPISSNLFSSGGDCTNFASQALLAGNMNMIFQTTPPTVDYPWYFVTILNYSHTWSVAHDFRYHWANVNGVGRERAYQFRRYTASGLLNDDSKWDELYSICSSGDIIQYVNGPSDEEYGKTSHSQVIHRRSDPDGAKKISMGQHSPNKWRNLRVESLTNVDSDEIICLIRIKRVQNAPEV